MPDRFPGDRAYSDETPLEYWERCGRYNTDYLIGTQTSEPQRETMNDCGNTTHNKVKG